MGGSILNCKKSPDPCRNNLEKYECLSEGVKNTSDNHLTFSPMLFSRVSFWSFTLVAIVLLTNISAPDVSAQDFMRDYRIHPDVWRPVQGIELGVGSGGDLGFAAPVLTIPGRGGLDYNVTFGYQSSIKPSQTSSWIGLGWSFDPGSITRDVQSAYDNSTETVYGADFAPNNVADIVMQPDIYYVSAPGVSFEMVRHLPTISGPLPPKISSSGFYSTKTKPWRIEPYGYDTPVSHPFGNLTLETCSQVGLGLCDSQNDYDGFVITDTNGIRYVFGHPTIATSTFQASSTAQLTDYYVDTWRLVAILGTEYPGNDIPCEAETGTSCDAPGSWIKFRYTLPDKREKTTEQGIKIKFQHTVVTTIETPTHYAEFVVGQKQNERASDVPILAGGVYSYLQEVRLHIKDTPSLIKKAKLNHDYLHLPASAVTGMNNRLRLNSIQFFGMDNESELPGYEFGYQDRIGCSGTSELDVFGYCTGVDPEDPTLHASSSWSLNSILYPTGDRDEISYESDTTGLNIIEGYTMTETTSCTLGDESFSQGSRGGSRVKSIETDFLVDTGQSKTQTFSYVGGRMTGVPSEYYQRSAPVDKPSFVPNGRSRARVIYQEVGVANVEDNTSSRTKYTTDVDQGASTVTTLVYHAQTADIVMRSNRDLNWGLVKAKYTIGNVSTSQINQYQGFLPAPLSKGFGLCGQGELLDVYWDGGLRIANVATHLGTGPSPVVWTTINYGYNVDPERTLKYTEISSSNAPTIRTEYIYQYQIETQIKDLNNFSSVYRTDVIEMDGGQRKYLQADVMLYKKCNTSTFCQAIESSLVGDGVPWVPHLSYQFKDDAPPASMPLFDPESDNWIRAVEYAKYDGYGNVLKQLGPMDEELTFSYPGGHWWNSYLSFVSANVSGLQNGIRLTMNYDDQKRLELIKDENGLDSRFKYDVHGRLIKSQRSSYGTGLGVETLQEYEYYMAREGGQGNVNFVRTETLNDAALPERNSKIFLNGSGATIQADRHLAGIGPQYITSAVELDGRNKPIKAFKPFPSTTGGFLIDPESASRTYYEQEYTTVGFPYDYIGYSYGQPTSTRVPSLEDDILRATTTSTYTVAVPDPAINGFAGPYNLTSTTDENGIIYKSYSDSRGLEVVSRTKTLSAETFTTTYLYDGLGRLIESRPPNYYAPPPNSDASDWVTTYTYNTRRELIEKNSPDIEGAYTYRYDKSGNLRLTVDPEGRRLYSKFDEINRVIETGEYCLCDPSEESNLWNYFGVRSATVTLSGTETTLVIHDPDPSIVLQRVHELIVNPDETYPTHDIFWVKIGDVEVFGRTSTVQFVENPSGEEITYTFEQFGGSYCDEMQDLIDGTLPNVEGTGSNSNISAKIWYNEAVPEVTDAHLNDRTWPLTSQKEVVTYQYDKYVGIVPPTGIPASRNDVIGKLTQVSNQGIHTGYYYDDWGQLALMYQVIDGLPSTPQGKTIEYSYNRFGEVTQVDYQHYSNNADEHVVFWYEYDTLGRLTKIKSSAGGHYSEVVELETTYRPTDQMASMALGAHATTGSVLQNVDYSYHIRDWLVGINDPGALGTDLFGMDLGYDIDGGIGATPQLNGNIAWTEWTGPTTSGGSYTGSYKFDYDGLNRLMDADFDDFVNNDDYDVAVQEYDANGNIISLSRSDGAGPGLLNSVYGQFTNTYEAGRNRLASIGRGDAYAYDKNGNVLHDWAERDYEYNRFDQPRSITKPISGFPDYEAGYRYDSGNLRIQVRDNASGSEQVTTYVRGADGAVIAVYDGEDLRHINVLAGSRVVGRIEPASSN